MSQFLKDMLASADPHKAGRDVRVADVLKQAALKADTAYSNDPALEAAVRDTIGTTFQSLGDLASAEPQIRRALQVRERVLGAEHPDTLASRNSLLEWLQNAGRHDEALGLGQDLLAARRRVLGSEHPDTLTTMNDTAIVLFQKGKTADAITLMQECVETRRRVLGEEHQKTLLAAGNLAAMYQQADRLDEAEPLLRRTLEISGRVSGPTHVDTLVIFNDLGLLLMDAKRLPDADAVFLEAVQGAFRRPSASCSGPTRTCARPWATPTATPRRRCAGWSSSTRRGTDRPRSLRGRSSSRRPERSPC